MIFKNIDDETDIKKLKKYSNNLTGLLIALLITTIYLVFGFLIAIYS